MEYRNLGRAGARVSVLGIGTTSFGRQCDQQQANAIVRRALDLGVNHFDTADNYGGGPGIAEGLLGVALSGRRHEAIIATKVGAGPPEPNRRGLSRRRIIHQCEGSLKRLRTDYIDVYYFHTPDPDTDIDESQRAMDDLIRQGKVCYAACSNYAGWEIARLCEHAKANGMSGPILTQSPFNLLSRQIEQELIPAAAAYGLGLIPFTPLARGLLTGLYRRGAPIPPGSHAANSPRFCELLQDEVLDAVEKLISFAEERGHMIAELAIAWLRASPIVSSVITGVVAPEEVEANGRALAWQLSGDDLNTLASMLRTIPAEVDTDV